MIRPCRTWNTDPARPVVTVAVAGLAMSLLAGCGGSSVGMGSGTAAATTTAAETGAAETGAAATTTAARGGTGDNPSFTDAQACAWLKEVLVAVKKLSDPINVQLNVVLSLADFFDKHGGLANAKFSGYDVDDATKRACSTEHDQLLKKAQIKSLGNL